MQVLPSRPCPRPDRDGPRQACVCASYSRWSPPLIPSAICLQPRKRMPTCSSTPARPASSSAESPPRRIRNPLRPRRSTAPRPRLNPRRPLGSQRRSANGGKHGRPARRCSSSGPTMSSYAGKRSSRGTSTAARWRERSAHRSPFDGDREDEAVKPISDRAPGHSYRRARARRAAASLRSRHLANERLWQAPAESCDHRRRGRWECATRRCSSP